eukprot:7391724-Prymnesium_polylepis.1
MRVTCRFHTTVNAGAWATTAEGHPISRYGFIFMGVCGPTGDDARKALHRSGEGPMPGYLPYDPLFPTAPMPLAV